MALKRYCLCLSVVALLVSLAHARPLAAAPLSARLDPKALIAKLAGNDVAAGASVLMQQPYLDVETPGAPLRFALAYSFRPTAGAVYPGLGFVELTQANGNWQVTHFEKSVAGAILDAGPTVRLVRVGPARRGLLVESGSAYSRGTAVFAPVTDTLRLALSFDSMVANTCVAAQSACVTLRGGVAFVAGQRPDLFDAVVQTLTMRTATEASVKTPTPEPQPMDSITRRYRFDGERYVLASTFQPTQAAARASRPIPAATYVEMPVGLSQDKRRPQAILPERALRVGKPGDPPLATLAQVPESFRLEGWFQSICATCVYRESSVEAQLHDSLLLRAWSPDHRRLAFAALRDGHTPDIYLFDPATGALRRAVDVPDMLYMLQWSPDGRYLFFSSGALNGTVEGTDGAAHTLYSVDTQTDKVRRVDSVALFPAYKALGWQDDRHIVISGAPSQALADCYNKALIVDVARASAALFSEAGVCAPAFDPRSRTLLYWQAAIGKAADSGLMLLQPSGALKRVGPRGEHSRWRISAAGGGAFPFVAAQTFQDPDGVSFEAGYGIAPNGDMKPLTTQRVLNAWAAPDSGWLLLQTADALLLYDGAGNALLALNVPGANVLSAPRWDAANEALRFAGGAFGPGIVLQRDDAAPTGWRASAG